MIRLASRANPFNKSQSMRGLRAEAREANESEKNPSVPMGTLKIQLKQRNESRRSGWMWETFPRQRWDEWLPQCYRCVVKGGHCWHRWPGRDQTKAVSPSEELSGGADTGLGWQTWAEDRNHWMPKGGT